MNECLYINKYIKIGRGWRKLNYLKLLTLLQKQENKLKFVFDNSRITVNNIVPKRLGKNILLLHGSTKKKKRNGHQKESQKGKTRTERKYRIGGINRKYIECTYLQIYSR